MHKFQENILGSSRNVSETTPRNFSLKLQNFFTNHVYFTPHDSPLFERPPYWVAFKEGFHFNNVVIPV